MIDLEGALFGHQPCPPGEIWIDDSDVIIVPKSKILVADDFIDLVFTRGIYGVFPMINSMQFIEAQHAVASPLEAGSGSKRLSATKYLRLRNG